MNTVSTAQNGSNVDKNGTRSSVQGEHANPLRQCSISFYERRSSTRTKLALKAGNILYKLNDSSLA